MKTVSRVFAAGAGGALLVGVLLGATNPMSLRSDGLQFPDGTVQVTAGAPKAFYLTRSPWDGASALVGCAVGFHMASLWEIHEVSTLRYATEIEDAHTLADSGSGPPAGSRGWIRTGQSAIVGDLEGQGNCNAWASSSSSDYGTIIGLAYRWDGLSGTPVETAPWDPATRSCDTGYRVWCVSD